MIRRHRAAAGRVPALRVAVAALKETRESDAYEIEID